MPYRTLGELRSELQARLGMGAMGASGANQVLLNSFLRNGQAQLYWAQDWKHLTDYEDKTSGVDQNLYDYPTAGAMVAEHSSAGSKRVLRVETNISGQFVRLEEGITTEMWSTMDTKGAPQRYERFAQLLVYPKADAATYTLRVWFVADLNAFSEDGNRASLDDEMVLLHAVANAKAHYRHPDADLYRGQLSELLSGLRGQSFKTGVYRRGDPTPAERKPALLGRDA